MDLFMTSWAVTRSSLYDSGLGTLLLARYWYTVYRCLFFIVTFIVLNKFWNFLKAKFLTTSKFYNWFTSHYIDFADQSKKKKFLYNSFFKYILLRFWAIALMEFLEKFLKIRKNIETSVCAKNWILFPV